MAARRYVAYYRVSTAKQGASGLGLDAQRQTVESYLNGGRWTILAEFVEVESGRKASRLKLAEAIAAARVYRAPLIVAKLDRLSRNVAFLCALRDSGVRVVFADMPDANDLTINVMASVAQYEAELISRRTKDALAAAKARGQKLGGRRLGQRLTDDMRAAGTAVQKDRAAARAAELGPIIAELQASGALSLSALARGLTGRNVPTARGGPTWTPTQVARVLQVLTSVLQERLNPTLGNR